MPTQTVMCSEQVNPESWVGGEIIYHQDRQHYYQTINSVDIKCQDGSWKKGWTYVRVADLFGNGTAFEVNCDPDEFKMFVRTNSDFDSDWILIRAIKL